MSLPSSAKEGVSNLCGMKPIVKKKQSAVAGTTNKKPY